MIQHIKAPTSIRVANKTNVHTATGGSDVYLLRYTKGFGRLPILWADTNRDGFTGLLASNLPEEVRYIQDVDLSDYILVRYSEIKGIHSNGKYVYPEKISGIIEEYKQELSTGNIPILSRLGT